MAETTPARPAIPIGGYSTIKPLTDDEREEWNRQAEAKREQIRVTALAMIGRGPDGQPFPAPDDAEERRLQSADLRGALRQAQVARREISLRGVDQKNALGRGELHLEEARTALSQLEERAAAGERAAADRLADSFRGSEASNLVQEVSSASMPATSEIETARIAVQRAEAAVERLAGETEATRAELVKAQYVVDRAVADVVRQKLLAIAQQIDEHDRAAAELRASMRAAGFTTANVARRAGWPRRIFTSTMLGVLDRGALDGASPHDWARFISALNNDSDTVLE
jgi:hypothetical protein